MSTRTSRPTATVGLSASIPRHSSTRLGPPDTAAGGGGFPTSAQPGRRALFGGADAPMPEDEPQFGSLWEHIAASGKGLFNYGEGLEIEGNAEIPGTEPEGQRLFLNAPLLRPIFEASDRRYPTFNLGIPDQFR